MSVARKLKFFFDPISPYTYFALKQLPKVAEKHGVKIVARPVLFAGLLNANGQKGPAEIVSKRRYTFLDCMRLSMQLEVPFKMPPKHPFNPLLFLRMATAVNDDSQRLALSTQSIAACWAEGRDLTDPAVMSSIASQVGLNGHDLLRIAQSDACKEQVRKNTDSAISKGVFGVPTFIVDNEVFFGHDRLSHVDNYLAGSLNINYNELEQNLLRPRGADRKNI